MRAAGIRHGQSPFDRIIDAKSKGNKASLEPSRMEAAVEHREHHWRSRRVFYRVLAEHADCQRTIERRRGTFSRDVAERECQAAFAIGKKVVKVAAQLTRRNIGRRNVESTDLARAARQQLELNFSRSIEIVLQAQLVFSRVLIEPRVFQRNGDEWSQRDEHPLMLCRKSSQLRAF